MIQIQERLHFDENLRTVNIGDGEAFMLLVGMFITRGLITTVIRDILHKL